MKTLKLAAVGIIILALVIGCASDQEKVDGLKQLKRELDSQVADLQIQKNDLERQVQDIGDKLRTHEALTQGKRPVYILELMLKQERFSLSLGKHLKDKMNEVKFDLAVDKTVYDRYDTKDKILDEKRQGSALTEGSASSWVIRVIGKRIEYK